jgi:proteasome assembly chaperone (PAC2) family protein
MTFSGIHIKHFPRLTRPILIAGFNGWGNALNVSEGMAAYLANKLDARKFASIDPDTYYRFDEHRPVVDIQDSVLKRVLPPGGDFYALQTDAQTDDLVILRADEPSLKWYRFVHEIFELCRQLSIQTVVTLGGMYDNVLHSDRIVSGIASDGEINARLRKWGILPISYHGPSAIHSVMLSEGPKYGIAGISLWCHCPYYLQGTTHYGLLSHMAKLLEKISRVDLDTADLDRDWDQLSRQIQTLIGKNGDLQKLVSDIRKDQMKGTSPDPKRSLPSDHKVIHLTDFLDPR